MNLLPKKVDIDKQKNEERRKEIDSGIQLATSIDKLRETKASEEKALFRWRENSLSLIQKEIDDYITVRDNLQKQTEEAEVYRKKLIEPLDEEWVKINEAKESIEEDKRLVLLAKNELIIENRIVEKNKENIEEARLLQKSNLKESEKLVKEASDLKKLATIEYAKAKQERSDQSSVYEKTMSEVYERLKEYEVALSLIAIRESEVKEKESDIIKREQHLETQQKTLKIAWDEIQKQK